MKRVALAPRRQVASAGWNGVALASRPGAHVSAGLGLIFAATFVLNASTSVIFALISDLQEATGQSTSSLGLIAGTGFIVAMLAGLLVAPLADRGRAKRLLLSGLGLAAIGGVGFAVAQSLPMLLASRALIGAAAGASSPRHGPSPPASTRRAGENLGRLARVDLAGFATGPIIGSLLFELVGLRGTFVFFAIVAAAALLLLAPRPLPSLPTSAESSRPSLVLLSTAACSSPRCSLSRSSCRSACSTRYGTATSRTSGARTSWSG